MYCIREVRESLGFSQKDLALAAAVSRPFLCDLEKNRRGAKPETLNRIATALGVSVADLEVA